MAVSENNTVQEQQQQGQEHGHQWESEYDDDEAEALSLSDLPILGRGNCERSNDSSSCLASEAEDFEFGSWVEDDPLLMCAADDVFYQGQILPLRPSVSSESGLLSGFRPDSQKSSRCGSRSDSMERSSGNSSCVFSSSSDRSRSSRSHSLSSSSSTYNFYAHPSPKPQMGRQLRRNAAKIDRKSSRWGLFRLGLVKTPEIELQDLRLRKRNSCSDRNINKNGEYRDSSSSAKKSTSSTSDGVKLLQKKEGQVQGLQRFFGGGLNCKCSADAVDTVSSRIVIIKSRKEVGDEGLGKQSMSRRRTFEWLRELSIAETPVA